MTETVQYRIDILRKGEWCLGARIENDKEVMMQQLKRLQNLFPNTQLRLMECVDGEWREVNTKGADL